MAVKRRTKKQTQMGASRRRWRCWKLQFVISKEEKLPCDVTLKPKQTIQDRISEVKRMVERLSAGLAAGRYRVKVGREGGVAFVGLSEEDRDRVTDACAYRRIMATGSPLAKAAIARAEQLAGRSVDRQAVAQGLHSHDGGGTWHRGH